MKLCYPIHKKSEGDVCLQLQTNFSWIPFVGQHPAVEREERTDKVWALDGPVKETAKPNKQLH
jgi:hypothetical protein